jgi:hypothetical protein
MMVERRQRPPGSAPGKCHRGIPGLYTLANAPDYSDEEWARYEEQRKQRKAKRDAEEGEECARYAEKQQRRIQDGAAILKVAPSQLKEPDIEALAWAVGYFQDNKDELTREGSKLYPIKQYRRYLAHAYEEHHRNPRPWSVFADPSFENASEVIEFCAFLIERGEPLPEALRSKVAEFLRKGGE